MTAPPTPTGRALSEDAARPRAAPAWIGLILLLGVGIVIGVPLALGTVIRPWSARNWPAAWCTVEYSNARYHRGNHSSSYSIEVRYVYVVDGKRRQSSQYRFFEPPRAASRIRIIINDLQRRPLRQCYYNPADPNQAVLDRSIGPDALLLLIPAAMIGLSLAGMSTQVRKAARLSEQAAGGRVFDAQSPRDTGPITLKAQSSPLRNFLVLLVFDAIFGGAAVFMLSQARQNYFVLVVGVPFALVSLLLILITISQLLASFNPVPTIRLSQSRLTLGVPADVRWSMSGQVNRIAKFTIVLRGREEIYENRKNNNRSANETFATLMLFETTRAQDISTGKASVVIPATQMHSFNFADCRIIWSLKVRGEIPRWPALEEEFVVQVIPPASGRR